MAALPDTSALAQQQTAKLVLLGEMGSGKSSLVLRYVKGQFFDYQVARAYTRQPCATLLGICWCSASLVPGSPRLSSHCPCNTQASTVGAAFLTKTIPELNIKFEIWCVRPLVHMVACGVTRRFQRMRPCVQQTSCKGF